MRSESKGSSSPEVGNLFTGVALSTDRSLAKDLSMSITVGTRKMVIYA
jgi:hypothetical protein